jgi:RNA polymerase sigma factor (sigma-70 family)
LLLDEVFGPLGGLVSHPAPRTTCTAVRTPSAQRPLRREDVGTLVHRAAGGDQHAWRLLIGRFDATIRSVARRHGLNDADRDEVAQRTWLALSRHIGSLRSHPAIAGWLLTTARHESLRVLASRRRELPCEDPIEGREPESEPIDEQLIAAERANALHGALARVPVHEQRLLRLMVTHPELSYDELSAKLGIPKGSIGPTRGRCISRLRGDRHLASVVHGRPLPGHDLL